MSNSLFTPRPAGPVESSIDWLTGTMLGTVATSVCVIAIAFVGFQMLSGKLPIVRGLRVIVGCFLLLGAPVVAASISGFRQRTRAAICRHRTTVHMLERRCGKTEGISGQSRTIAGVPDHRDANADMSLPIGPPSIANPLHRTDTVMRLLR
jgi:type IV secretory pathway VirB2 component (pilin)